MELSAEKLAQRLRNQGERDLERWARSPAILLPVLMLAVVALVNVAAIRGIPAEAKGPLDWLIPITTGALLGLGFLWLNMVADHYWALYAGKFVVHWQPILVAHFQETLRDPRLLPAIISGELCPELRAALSPETWSKWERPLQSGWITTNLQPLQRRVYGVFNHYARCCRALALAPLPAGYVSRNAASRLWSWLNGDIWPSVLRIALADALARDATGGPAPE